MKLFRRFLFLALFLFIAFTIIRSQFSFNLPNLPTLSRLPDITIEVPNFRPVTTPHVTGRFYAPALTEAFVVRVIDGDTIVLDTGDRVRLIGINAPELGEPGADEAARFVKEYVYQSIVWLETSGADTDRFGRLRRYVWLRVPDNTRDAEQIGRYQLNRILIDNGLVSEFMVR